MISLSQSSHMQRDIELFANYDSSSETTPVFFFYTWDAPAITIGKIQRNREQLIDEAGALGIPCYLRPTGGRAVLHGGDICYTFIAAQSDPVYGGTLQESFKKVNEMVIALVNQVLMLNVQCSTLNANVHAIPFSIEPSALSMFNCFSTHVSNEGLFNGHKIIGAAQAMGSRSFIQQGSIQLNKIDVDLKHFQSHKTLSELTNTEYDLAELLEDLNI